MEFYDLHVYLNDLLCIARIINPEFQSHISRIMAPMAHLALVEPGPLKSLARCRAKVELAYALGTVILVRRMLTYADSRWTPSTRTSSGQPLRTSWISCAYPSHSIASTTSGTPFACFTSTKVQILTQKAQRGPAAHIRSS
jgi:hypothetical protein